MTGARLSSAVEATRFKSPGCYCGQKKLFRAPRFLIAKAPSSVDTAHVKVVLASSRPLHGVT